MLDAPSIINTPPIIANIAGPNMLLSSVGSSFFNPFSIFLRNYECAREDIVSLYALQCTTFLIDKYRDAEFLIDKIERKRTAVIAVVISGKLL